MEARVEAAKTSYVFLMRSTAMIIITFAIIIALTFLLYQQTYLKYHSR
jgi:hypothetical protein